MTRLGALDLTTCALRVEGRVAWCTIDHPPINLMTRDLFVDLLRVSEAAAADDDLGVFVLQSAVPDFFIAHFDVELLLAGERTPDPPPPTELNAFGVLCERFETMPAVTIAKIAGRVGGGGAELSMACDLRYGALGRAVVNQMEVPIGILPGGGGTQRLPRLIGPSRAAELILGGLDLDAETGERWGWFTRALPPEELDDHVDTLARRIAGFPPAAVAEAKASLRAGRIDPQPGLLEESHRFARLLATDAAHDAMRAFLARGGQTPDGERRVADLMVEPPQD